MNNSLIQDDYLNAGDWVLLTDYPFRGSAGDAPVGKNWRWYQVQRVDPPSPTEQEELLATGNPVTTTLVLPGGWPGTDLVPSESGTQVLAIVLSNVVAVYEKTIRIEYDSIWNE